MSYCMLYSRFQIKPGCQKLVTFLTTQKEMWVTKWQRGIFPTFCLPSGRGAGQVVNAAVSSMSKYYSWRKAEALAPDAASLSRGEMTFWHPGHSTWLNFFCSPLQTNTVIRQVPPGLGCNRIRSFPHPYPWWAVERMHLKGCCEIWGLQLKWWGWGFWCRHFEMRRLTLREYLRFCGIQCAGYFINPVILLSRPSLLQYLCNVLVQFLTQKNFSKKVFLWLKFFFHVLKLLRNSWNHSLSLVWHRPPRRTSHTCLTSLHSSLFCYRGEYRFLN